MLASAGSCCLLSCCSHCARHLKHDGVSQPCRLVPYVGQWYKSYLSAKKVGVGAPAPAPTEPLRSALPLQDAYGISIPKPVPLIPGDERWPVLPEHLSLVRSTFEDRARWIETAILKATAQHDEFAQSSLAKLGTTFHINTAISLQARLELEEEVTSSLCLPTWDVLEAELARTGGMRRPCFVQHNGACKHDNKDALSYVVGFSKCMCTLSAGLGGRADKTLLVFTTPTLPGMPQLRAFVMQIGSHGGTQPWQRYFVGKLHGKDPANAAHPFLYKQTDADVPVSMTLVQTSRQKSFTAYEVGLFLAGATDRCKPDKWNVQCSKFMNLRQYELHGTDETPPAARVLAVQNFPLKSVREQEGGDAGAADGAAAAMPPPAVPAPKTKKFTVADLDKTWAAFLDSIPTKVWKDGNSDDNNDAEDADAMSSSGSSIMENCSDGEASSGEDETVVAKRARKVKLITELVVGDDDKGHVEKALKAWV